MTYRVAQKIQRARLTGAQLSATGKQVIGSLSLVFAYLPAFKTLFSRFLLSCSVHLFCLPTTHQTCCPYTITFPPHPTRTQPKMSDQGDEISQVTYEQLAGIEDEFEEIDTQISTSLASPANNSTFQHPY